jgi:hypothetical protein
MVYVALFCLLLVYVCCVFLFARAYFSVGVWLLSKQIINKEFSYEYYYFGYYCLLVTIQLILFLSSGLQS